MSEAYADSAAEAQRAGRHWLVPAAYLFLLDEAGRVLLQLRSGTGFMDGHWAAAAAGHVDPGESVLQAVRREAREELGIAVDAEDLLPLTVMHRNQRSGSAIDQRVDFFFAARRWSGEPRVMEPGKSAGLRWAALADLPDPVVPHERFVLVGLREGSLQPVSVFGFGDGPATR